MSKETSKWLNTMTLIGHTLKRGKAWTYREELQGDKSNHYEGAIPVEDVIERLFNFKVVERRQAIELPVGEIQADGTRAMEWVPQDDLKAMCIDDEDNTRLGMFKSGWVGHNYEDWLVSNVSHILDDDLSIGSAGLLANRAQAWVSVEVSDNIMTPEGVEFRPNLVACTSFNGSLATTYKRTVTNVVCDNTLRCGLSEDGQVFKARHTKNSGFKLQKAKDALQIVHTVGDEFAAEVKRLCETSVSDAQWKAIVSELVPMPEADKSSKRGVTVCETKREKLQTLWDHDSRVSTWANTGFGVVQAFNTYHHHISTVKAGQTRGQRNMDDAISGLTAKGDEKVIQTMELILAN